MRSNVHIADRGPLVTELVGDAGRDDSDADGWGRIDWHARGRTHAAGVALRPLLRWCDPGVLATLEALTPTGCVCIGAIRKDVLEADLAADQPLEVDEVAE